MLVFIFLAIFDNAHKLLMLHRSAAYLRDTWQHVTEKIEPNDSAWQASL